MHIDSEIAAHVVNKAPRTPGCYLYKDVYGNIIYVGKAKNLKNRVRQYFNPEKNEWEKLNRLVNAIADVEFTVTDTELDALLLEHKLIKQYKPWFNSQLKRDVEHPYLCINVSIPYPSIYISDVPPDDNSVFYDCFFDRGDAHTAIDTLNDIWRTPICGKSEYKPGSKLCLNFHIGRCLGPCAGQADPSEYKSMIKEILDFFDGRTNDIFERMETEMKAFADKLEFENAAECQRRIDKLKRLEYKTNRSFDPATKSQMIMVISPYKSKQYSLFYLTNGNVLCRTDIFKKDTAVNHDQATAIKSVITPNTCVEQKENQTDVKPETYIDRFLSSIVAAKDPLPENDWLKEALPEIHAEKHMVILQDDITRIPLNHMQKTEVMAELMSYIT